MGLPHSRRNLGFTLIELLVVIAIIAVLISIGLASYTRAQRSARDTQRKADLRNVAGALEQFYADYNRYPDSGSGEINDASCSTNPKWDGTGSFSCGGRVYLAQLPDDPLPTQHYYYQSCLAGTAQSYALFTNIEGSPGTLSSPPCTNPDATIYDYWVTSQ